MIGLGNRLNVFQDKLVDALTSDSTIDLTLPGQKPCAYFCILSAQDSTYAFLSSLFFAMLFSRLEAYARREKGGKLPVPVNFLLDEFPSIGKLGDFKRSIAFTRSFGMQCQVLIQSVAQLADMYPRHEWEEIAACCDATICLGVNDPTSAKFISEKCGMTTIQVTNNQSPQTPLLSPLQNNIRPYSMTRSNTQRALMQPDEVLRLDNAQCIVLLRGQYPMLLYCEELTIGPCTYPRLQVRETLWRLNWEVLDCALAKLRENEKAAMRNTLVYTAKVVYSTILERGCDIRVFSFGFPDARRSDWGGACDDRRAFHGISRGT